VRSRPHFIADRVSTFNSAKAWEPEVGGDPDRGGGGPCRDRTCGPLIKSQLLCQLRQGNGPRLGSRFSCNTSILVDPGTKELHLARYQRVSVMEREEVSRMLAAGSRLRATGRALGRAPSTLVRELARQHASPVTYRAVTAPPRAQR